VWIEAPFVQHDLESDAVVDPAARRTIHGYATHDAGEGAARDVGRALAEAGVVAAISRRDVEEEDWAESWKEHFHVERFGEHLVVVPTWRAFEAARGDITIALDPGMAFGTGQHETTRMCLEALERAVRPGMAVLDAGCGSGILSLAAAKLGAREVVALDIDANCVRVTSDNARLNGVEAVVAARQGSVGDAWPADLAARSFDVVVANIIARVIIEAAPALADALAPGGRLIVSGIIAEREGETVAALTAQGIEIASVRGMGEWRCIEGVHP
jgi:ribosomal protein L11 methyltransferase